MIQNEIDNKGKNEDRITDLNNVISTNIMSDQSQHISASSRVQKGECQVVACIDRKDVVMKRY